MTAKKKTSAKKKSREVTWPTSVRKTIQRVKAVSSTLKSVFAGRDEAIDLLALGAVCQEHVLLVGPPGTAKTKLISRFAERIDASTFSYLLTRFTEPTELFGPVDVEEFRKGNYRVKTSKMLPECEVVFLDEVFRGSSPILNSLLTILNERVYFNGSETQRVPLVLLVGATNEIPNDSALQALADRFSLRVEVDPVPEDKLDDLLDLGWELEREMIATSSNEDVPGEIATVPLKELVDLHGRIREVGTKGIQSEYAQVVRELRAEGVQLSDRRAVKGLKLVAGAALLREARTAEIQDFWPLVHLWGIPDERRQIAQVIHPRIASAGVDIRQAVREVPEILFDLESLVEQAPTFHTDATIGAHLMSLNALRRELSQSHPEAKEALGMVDQAIQGVMTRLEPSNV